MQELPGGCHELGVLRDGIDQQDALVHALLAADGVAVVVVNQLQNGAKLGLWSDEVLALRMVDLEVEHLAPMTVCG